MVNSCEGGSGASKAFLTDSVISLSILFSIFFNSSSVANLSSIISWANFLIGSLLPQNSFSFSEAASFSFQGGGLNILGDAMVLNSTNDYFAFTPCGNDTVSRTKKLLEGFIEKSNSYEERMGKIIDPLTNEVINMQYDLQVIQEQVSEIMTGSVNLIRKKIVKNINKAIKDDKKKEKTKNLHYFRCQDLYFTFTCSKCAVTCYAYKGRTFFE